MTYNGRLLTTTGLSISAKVNLLNEVVFRVSVSMDSSLDDVAFRLFYVEKTLAFIRAAAFVCDLILHLYCYSVRQDISLLVPAAISRI